MTVRLSLGSRDELRVIAEELQARTVVARAHPETMHLGPWKETAPLALRRFEIRMGVVTPELRPLPSLISGAKRGQLVGIKSNNLVAPKYAPNVREVQFRGESPTYSGHI